MNKQQALDLFEDKRKEFLTYCRWIAQRVYYQKGHVTVDDIRVQVQIPSGIDGRVMGAVFNKQEWEKVGYTQTAIKSSHGRPIAVFRLKNPKKSVPDYTIDGSTTQMGLL